MSALEGFYEWRDDLGRETGPGRYDSKVSKQFELNALQTAGPGAAVHKLIRFLQWCQPSGRVGKLPPEDEDLLNDILDLFEKQYPSEQPTAPAFDPDALLDPDESHLSPGEIAHMISEDVNDGFRRRS